MYDDAAAAYCFDHCIPSAFFFQYAVLYQYTAFSTAFQAIQKILPFFSKIFLLSQNILHLFCIPYAIRYLLKTYFFVRNGEHANNMRILRKLSIQSKIKNAQKHRFAPFHFANKK